MIYELLKPKLPLLAASLCISLAIDISTATDIDLQRVFRRGSLIFTTLGLLQRFAPKVHKSVLQGLGFNIGLNTVKK